MGLRRYIESDIDELRDPFVLEKDGVYYMYGTGWQMYKNATGDLAGAWEGPFSFIRDPADCDGCRWAPEVHEYRGAYYAFTTYRSAESGRKGCAVFRAASPEGPFGMISRGHFTPSDREAIDATLYVDPDGKPWTVFVHEWVSPEDGVGRMDVAPMTDDLTALSGEPVEIFRADDPEWVKPADGTVTDGPFVRTMSDGSLLMIWSTFLESGYAVGTLRSDRITGPWVHGNGALFRRGTVSSSPYDGGHGMIFRALDGSLYLAVHSPNDSREGRGCKPVFVPVREEDGELVTDL